MITVLGGRGFIGSHIVKLLKKRSIVHYVPGRAEDIKSKKLGDIIYCIGLTADFRHRPFETVEAHVCHLKAILEEATFDSLTYLSSTRVYISCKQEIVHEDSPITISINNPDELYTLTKLTGERLCLSSGRKVRIARLSNVYGVDFSSENFITEIIKKILSEKFVKFNTTSDSAKDYIAVDVLSDLLIRIAEHGEHNMYNVASGENISNNDIVETLKKYYAFNYAFDEKAKKIIFPRINIDRIKSEFGVNFENNRSNLSKLIKKYGDDNN